MPFIKLKTYDDKIICVNSNLITYIEEEESYTIIWLAGVNGLKTTFQLNEILRMIKEAENAK